MIILVRVIIENNNSGTIINKVKFTKDNNHKENTINIVLLLFIYNSSIISINHSSINTNSINDLEIVIKIYQ